MSTNEFPNNHTVPIPDWLEDRERFLKLRDPYFNVSAAACLFGEHPFLSAADYWLEKVAGTRQEETMAMRRGHHLEEGVALWFAHEMGWKVTKNENMFVCGHMAATPDYWTNDLTDIVEIKTTAKIIDEPEAYWLWQVQGQMLCTQAPRAHVVWVDASMDIKNVVVPANHEMQHQLWAASEAFMLGVKDELMPDFIETQARHIIAMYPEPEDSIEGGDEAMQLVTDYWAMKRSEKDYKERADKLRDVLFAFAGNHEAITHDGTQIATLRPRKVAASFNKKKFELEHPDLYLEYMGEPTTTRVLNIPKRLKETLENE